MYTVVLDNEEKALKISFVYVLGTLLLLLYLVNYRETMHVVELALCSWMYILVLCITVICTNYVPAFYLL